MFIQNDNGLVAMFRLIDTTSNSSSVLRRPFDVVDDQYIEWHRGAFESQPELFLHGREDAGRGISRGPCATAATHRLEANLEIVATGEPCFVNDGAPCGPLK